jgi:UDP-3-O-[3-hydroxymyristoyl] glucosamine N-acyltransferase
MTLRAKDIAALVSGELHGDGLREIHAIKGLKAAQDGHLSFLVKQKYKIQLSSSLASVFIIPKNLDCKLNDAQTYIKVANVMEAVQLISEKLVSNHNTVTAISPLCQLAASVKSGEHVNIDAYSVLQEGVTIGIRTSIGSQVYIGENVSIGSHCIIYPGVKIYANSVIGDHVIIHSNAVIGSDGFGFHFDGNHFKKIHHTGNVVIEDHVEIGSNTVIDRAAFDTTIIREGTKLDNLIQIAHNVAIGKHNVIAAQTGISGSVEIGNGCQIGGQVGIAGHLTIADGTEIQAKSGVPSSITEPNQKWYGYPILKFRDYLKSYAIFKKLPLLLIEVDSLKKELKNLIGKDN